MKAKIKSVHNSVDYDAYLNPDTITIRQYQILKEIVEHMESLKGSIIEVNEIPNCYPRKYECNDHQWSLLDLEIIKD